MEKAHEPPWLECMTHLRRLADEGAWLSLGESWEACLATIQAWLDSGELRREWLVRLKDELDPLLVACRHERDAIGLELIQLHLNAQRLASYQANRGDESPTEAD